MNDKKFRVIQEEDFLVLDPPYRTPAKEMAKALQNDMQVAAQHIRNALYDLHKMDCLTGGLSHRLKQSLIALDFSHFIPISNTSEALYQEFLSLQAEIDEMSRDMEHDMNLMASIAQAALDIEDELERRGYWSEIVLADMTTVSLWITPEDFCWMCNEKCTCGSKK